MENLFERFTIATQNVDSLHQRAGSRNVIELHGHLREAHCTRCAATRPIPDGIELDEIRHECGGMFRPSVVWFGEALPVDAWRRAEAAALDADVVLVVGTSSVVYPAASLAHLNDRAFVVEINPDATAAASMAAASIREPAGIALPRIADAVAVGR